MAIILYDAIPSSNSDRVKIALHEKGLAYERVTLDLAKKEQKRPEFLKLNPYGKVPVINDNGQILFESCIINEYLDEQYPNPPLMPKDPYLRGRGRVLVDYALNYLHEPYWALRGEMLKKESERNIAIMEEKRHILRNLLQYLEEALGDKSYFLGEISLTDIDVLPRFLRMESYGALPTPSLPRIGAWLKRIKERPSVKAIL
ncbi:MAG: glutathione S-transferase family protein [Deltaproteobacteria bacterium]|nr:MAG: glutathione S-transferase family protein [Deltaproteobacteria bacterium]